MIGTDKNCWLVDYLGVGINTCSVTNILDKNVDITSVILFHDIYSMLNLVDSMI